MIAELLVIGFVILLFVWMVGGIYVVLKGIQAMGRDF